MPNRHFSDLFSLAKLMESIRMESEQRSTLVYPIDYRHKVIKNTSSGVRLTGFLSLTVSSPRSVTEKLLYASLHGLSEVQ